MIGNSGGGLNMGDHLRTRKVSGGGEGREKLLIMDKNMK